VNEGLSPDGAHLHIALADSNGIVVGGHLGPGSAVHTTLEVVVAELEGAAFSREPDPRTGYEELVIRSKEN
jgi:predicted DNA-binding protein with PD1-like motif